MEQKYGDDGIEEEVNFSVQSSSVWCQMGIDIIAATAAASSSEELK